MESFVGDSSSSIPPGIYVHFKGEKYEVFGIARHSESLDEVVVYRKLYGDFGYWIRPVSMFTGTVERDGETLQRFTKLASP